MPPTKKVVRRRRPAEAQPGRACTCGKIRVEERGSDLVIHGPGWLQENQFVRCGHCSTRIRYAPRVTWQTESGERYSTRGYLGDGEDRKVS